MPEVLPPCEVWRDWTTTTKQTSWVSAESQRCVYMYKWVMEGFEPPDHPKVPFDFAPPCPLIVALIESFRIRLLGGLTLDRRKWCWSWHGGAGSDGVGGCWFEPNPVRFGGEAGRTWAEPEPRPVADGLRISTRSSPFVLRSSLACSPLSSSSQPSGFLDGFLFPSIPIPSLDPGVMLPKHIRR